MSIVAAPHPNNPPRNALLRAEYDQRYVWTKAVHTVVMIWREFIFLMGMLFHRIFYAHAQPALQIAHHPESRGLIVLLHGLQSSPAIWSTQLALLNQQRVDIFAPDVPEKGMCSLEDAAQPIYPLIRNYAAQNPQKRIALLGVSNGSRIATWLETHLRQDAPQSAVMVSTIAGVHLGSSRMNLLDKFRIARRFYPAALGDELKYGSPFARELLDKVIAPLPAGCAPRSYEFYATTDDLSVPDLDSSLPLLNKGERYRVIHGHSHDSIVAAVADEQIHSCLEWVQRPARA